MFHECIFSGVNVFLYECESWKKNRLIIDKYIQNNIKNG